MEDDRFGTAFFISFFLYLRDTRICDRGDLREEMRDAKTTGKTNVEHVTRPLTESIREKSRVGQLTRRRAISGSERGIKGAWELYGERMGGVVEKGWYEKRREICYYALPAGGMYSSTSALLVEFYLFTQFSRVFIGASLISY